MAEVSDPTVAADRLERGLDSLSGRWITRQGVTLYFAGGMVRGVIRNDLLAPANAGSLLVEPSQSGVRVWFRLEVVHFFWIISMIVLLVFGPPLLTAPNVTRTEGVLLLLGSWVWLFGFNVLLLLFRLPRWIRRAAADYDL